MTPSLSAETLESDGCHLDIFLSIEIKLGFYGIHYVLVLAEMMALMKWFAVVESWRSLA